MVPSSEKTLLSKIKKTVKEIVSFFRKLGQAISRFFANYGSLQKTKETSKAHEELPVQSQASNKFKNENDPKLNDIKEQLNIQITPPRDANTEPPKKTENLKISFNNSEQQTLENIKNTKTLTLIKAIADYNIDTIRKILQDGIDIDRRIHTSFMPPINALGMAVSALDVKVVTLLLAHNASPYFYDKDKLQPEPRTESEVQITDTVLHFLEPKPVWSKEDHLKARKIYTLISAQIKPIIECDGTLRSGVAIEDLETLIRSIKYFRMLKAKDPTASEPLALFYESETAQSPIFHTISKKLTSNALFLLKNAKIDSKSCSFDFEKFVLNAFIYACNHKDLAVIDFCIKYSLTHKSNDNPLIKDGKMFCEVLTRNLSILEKLIENELDLSQPNKLCAVLPLSMLSNLFSFAIFIRDPSVRKKMITLLVKANVPINGCGVQFLSSHPTDLDFENLNGFLIKIFVEFSLIADYEKPLLDKITQHNENIKGKKLIEESTQLPLPLLQIVSSYHMPQTFFDAENYDNLTNTKKKKKL